MLDVAETVRLRWRSNCHALIVGVVYGKKKDAQFKFQISQRESMTGIEVEAKREVEVSQFLHIKYISLVPSLLGTGIAFEDLDGNLPGMVRLCRDTCQIRLLLLNSDGTAFEKQKHS